jgi:hypothetical protein
MSAILMGLVQFGVIGFIYMQAGARGALLVLAFEFGVYVDSNNVRLARMKADVSARAHGVE